MIVWPILNYTHSLTRSFLYKNNADLFKKDMRTSAVPAISCVLPNIQLLCGGPESFSESLFSFSPIYFLL